MPGGGPRYEPRQAAPAPETLLLDGRRKRIDDVVAQRTRSVAVVLDRLEDNFNMAAVLRTCEGLGILEVHVVENPDVPFEPNGAVTQGCDKWLDIARYRDFAACRKALAGRGFALWASTVRPEATPLEEVRWDGKVALIFGNERYGVSDDVLRSADGTFWIPMRGFSGSFNISVAAAMVLSHAMRSRPAGDLTPEEAAALKYRYSALSVKQRKRLYPRQPR
jgi:tRNA (guanosine-2'-O-)-methyltransferase